MTRSAKPHAPPAPQTLSEKHGHHRTYLTPNKPMRVRVAQLQGARARHTGKPLSACPFPKKRLRHTNEPSPNAFRAAWKSGWHIEDRYLSTQGP